MTDRIMATARRFGKPVRLRLHSAKGKKAGRVSAVAFDAQGLR